MTLCLTLTSKLCFENRRKRARRTLSSEGEADGRETENCVNSEGRLKVQKIKVGWTWRDRLGRS